MCVTLNCFLRNCGANFLRVEFLKIHLIFMKRSLPIISLFILTVVAAPASGAMIKGGEILSIDNPVGDDLYIAGGQIYVTENIDGDLIAAGGELIIQGDVAEDLTLAGGRITVSGDIDDDARIAGGEVRVTGTIGDDLFVTGGRVELGEDAVVKGDMRVAGGEVFIDGVIEGDLDIRAGRVVLRGTIKGNIDVEGGDITIFATVEGTSRIVADKISLGSSASFRDNVEYWQKDGEVDFTPALDGAGAVFNPKLARSDFDAKKLAPKFLAVGFIASIVMSVLFAAFFILIAAFLTKGMFLDAAKKMKVSFLGSTLSGFLYFMVTPIVIILLMITIVGIPISIFSGVFYGFTIYFAKPVTAMVLAKLMELHHKKKRGKWGFIGFSILFYILLKILGFVPIIGWIVCFVIVCSAYGALITTKWEKFKKLR